MYLFMDIPQVIIIIVNIRISMAMVKTPGAFLLQQAAADCLYAIPGHVLSVPGLGGEGRQPLLEAAGGPRRGGLVREAAFHAVRPGGVQLATYLDHGIRSTDDVEYHLSGPRCRVIRPRCEKGR